MSPRTLRVTARNSAFQVLESLRGNRQTRHRSRTFLVEGVLPISRALAHGWTFEAVAYAPDAGLSAWASDAIVRSHAPIRYELSRELLAELSGKSAPSELLAAVRMADDDLGRIRVAPDLLVVVMDSPSNSGNLGTLVRSCDALGAQGVLVTGHAVDVYDPAVVTASRGSLFSVPVVRLDSSEAVGGWLTDVRATLGRCVLVGADEAGEVEVWSHDFTPPTVIVLGNEARGLSRAHKAMCDGLVRIPMSGSATSLNVSVAASIVLYEAARQRASTP